MQAKSSGITKKTTAFDSFRMMFLLNIVFST